MRNSAAQLAEQGIQSSRRIVTIALLIAMMVAALEQTVVSTAMPRIVAQFKSINLYSWVFSAYLLAATVSTPLFGKLADLLGRKRVLLFGLGMFAVGSMLSGLAVNMPHLIAMRVVQGIGAGALMPIVLTMIGDLFTIQERARIQGLFSGVWGGVSLIGPAVGGILTDYLSWRWVFFITVPFAMISAAILVAYVRETIPSWENRAPIDWPGAALLTLSSGIILATALGSPGHEPSAIAAPLCLGVALSTALVFWEKRARDPIMPLDLLSQRETGIAIASSFLIGGIVFAVDTYIPLYMQGVLGRSATKAGGTITPLFLAWSVSVAVAARVLMRLGFRGTAILGGAFNIAGSLLLVAGAIVRPWTEALFVVGLVAMGLGMGPASLATILVVQNAVPWERRGVATASATFFRTLGGALCVGLLGATISLGLSSRLATSNGARIDVSAILNSAHVGEAPSSRVNASGARRIQSALGDSLRDVFLQVVGLSGLNLLLVSFMPGGRLQKEHDRTGKSRDAPAGGFASATDRANNPAD